jgi:hypothetical protein
MDKTKAQPRPKKAADPAEGKASPPKKRTDWDAVERDYRTAKFTLRELAQKYGVTHQAINNQAKRKQWTQDLADQIRQATNAKLVAKLVDEGVAKGGQEVANTVLAAAEVNTRVILGHRKDIQATRDVAAGMLQELSATAMLSEHVEMLAQVLAGSGAEPVDEAKARAAVQKALSITTRIQGVKALADTFDKLQLAERRAFSLDEKGGKDPASGLQEMATAELQKLRQQLMGG